MTTDVLDLRTSYMLEAHDPEILSAMAEEKLKGVDYDTLVGTGLSGTIAVTELARRLGKNYLIVRKSGDGTHSNLPVEGKLGKRWIFVDDLISTGRTVNRVGEVVSRVAEKRSHQTKCVGIFLYADARHEERFYDEQSDLTMAYFG